MAQSKGRFEGREVAWALLNTTLMSSYSWGRLERSGKSEDSELTEEGDVADLKQTAWQSELRPRMA